MLSASNAGRRIHAQQKIVYNKVMAREFVQKGQLVFFRVKCHNLRLFFPHQIRCLVSSCRELVRFRS